MWSPSTPCFPEPIRPESSRLGEHSCQVGLPSGLFTCPVVAGCRSESELSVWTTKDHQQTSADSKLRGKLSPINCIPHETRDGWAPCLAGALGYGVNVPGFAGKSKVSKVNSHASEERKRGSVLMPWGSGDLTRAFEYVKSQCPDKYLLMVDKLMSGVTRKFCYQECLRFGFTGKDCVIMSWTLSLEMSGMRIHMALSWIVSTALR